MWIPTSAVSVDDAIRVLEDYKPLDIESASMAMTLCRGIRARYPDWKHLIDYAVRRKTQDGVAPATIKPVALMLWAMEAARVAIGPGDTAWTRIFCGPNSTEIGRAHV